MNNTAKRTFAPGEKGKVEIIFDLRGRTGKQRKATVVTTSDGQEHRLVVEVDIPKTYTVAPLLVRWAKDSETKSKTARLVNQNKTSIKLLSASSPHKNLSSELRTIREGFEYEVEITCLNFDSRIRSFVSISTEPPPGQMVSKTIQVYVLVP